MSGETETPQDPLSQGEGPASGKGSTSAEGQVLTAEQIAKLRSDAAAEAGRQRKAAEQARDAALQELQALRERMDQLEKAEQEAKLEGLKGDPEKHKLYLTETTLKQKEKQLLLMERDLQKKKEEVEEKAAAIEAEIRASKFSSVLQRHGVSQKDVEDLNITDPDVLDKVLSKFKPKEEASSKEDDWFASFKPDSGASVGGTSRLNQDSAKRMSVKDFEKTLLAKD